MPTTVKAVLPHRDDATAKDQIVDLLKVAAAVGVALEPGGFAQSWLGDSTRVIVAHDDDKPTGFAVVAFGRRWFDENFTASVVLMQGPARAAMFSYIRDMAAMLGARKLFWEFAPGDECGGIVTDQRMLEL